jgi:teichuronic acid biosynthesis glycosyltransferase TuaC
MNILIVCSGNAPDFSFEKSQAFVYDQLEAVKNQYEEIKIHTFFIKGRGLWGYLKNIYPIRRMILNHSIDIVHAHYALSGLLANLQRRVPVITTYHGSDINNKYSRSLAVICAWFSKANIYVAEDLADKAIKQYPNKDYVLPCGIDLELFRVTEVHMERKESQAKRRVLFSSAFDNAVKNYPLLEKSIKLIDEYDIEVVELRGYNRTQVAKLMSEVDVCAMTSFSEGSPQFIKEAMAMNCPIVATDVGDVRKLINGVEGCYISSYDPENYASNLMDALRFRGRTEGRRRILALDNRKIAKQIVKIYREVSQ